MDPLLEKNLISTKDAGELTGYTPDYLARLARSKKILSHRLGHAWFIDRYSLEKFIKEQEERKSTYARNLSTLRTNEYRSKIPVITETFISIPKLIQRPLEVELKKSPWHSQITAVSTALLVVVFGVFGSQFIVQKNLPDKAVAFATQLSQGFDQSFGVLPNQIAARQSFVSKQFSEAANDVSNSVYGNPLSAATIASASQFLLTNIQAPVVANNTELVSSQTLVPNQNEKTFSSITNSPPESLAKLVMAIIESPHAIIAAETNFIYWMAETAPSSSRAIVQFTGNLGTNLATNVAESPQVADLALNDFASNTKNALYTFSSRGATAFAGLNKAILQGLSTANIATAAAINGLSFGDQVALYTYETLHGLALSTDQRIATLFGSAPSKISTTTPQMALTQIATTSVNIPSTLAPVVTSSTSNTASASPVLLTTNTPKIISAATAPTIIVQGISKDTLDSALATLQSNLLSTVEGLVTPVAAQTATNVTSIQQVNDIQDLTNLTVNNGTFNGGTFNDGTLSNGVDVSSNNGSFTNLFGGITSLATTTVNGLLTAFYSVAAPYFTATSTTATSTFAGAFAVGTSSPFGNGLLTVGTSSPLLYVDDTTGLIGIGSTSPTTNFSVAGSEYLTGGLGVGTSTTSPGSLAISGNASILGNTTIGGLLSALNYITAPYFTATSTTATSTFAGAFAVGTSSPFGNGLLTVGTSSPLLYIDNRTGLIGIGSTSPTTNFSVAGNGYFTGGLGVGAATTSPGALAVSGNAYVGGNLTVAGGSTVLGNSSTQSLTINASINSSIVPNQNLTYNLGSPAFYWNNAYIGNLNANNISAASTTIGGTSNTTFTLNSGNSSTDQTNSSLIFFRGAVVPNALLTWDAATSSKRFEFNQSLYINNASASTTEPTLTLQGVAGQTANILQIASSTGSTIFAVDANGNATLSSLNLTAALPLSSGGTATTTFYNGGIIFSDGTKLTQASSPASLFWDNVNNRLGLGTSTPSAQLSINPNGINGPALLVGSSTATDFAISNGGLVGVGTASPFEQFTVSGLGPTFGRVGQGTLNANGHSIYVQGRYAYVVDSGTTNSLEIWDISNSASPTRVGQGTLNAGQGNSVYVQGRYAYVVDGSAANDFEIWDISNPASPSRVGQGTLNAGGDSVYVQGRYAYITDASTANDFEVWDISNSAFPTRVGQGALNTTTGEYLYVQGRYAYIVTTNSLEVWDISNPASPTRTGLGTLNTTGHSIYVQGRYAYVVDLSTTNSLEVWDISNPASLSRVGQGTLANAGRSISVQGRYAYVGENGGVLDVWDISSPASPVRVSQGTLNNNDAGVYVQGRYAYAADTGTTNSFEIWDLGGAYIQQAEVGSLEAGSVAIRDNLTGVDANFTGGLTVGGSINTSYFNLEAATSTYNTTTSIFNVLTASSTGPILNVLGNGNVGIGTTSPFAQFSLFSGSDYGSHGLSTLFAVGSSTAGTATSTLFDIISNGNVGIGSSTPATALAIQQTVASPQLTIAYNTLSYANIQVDSAGDLLLAPSNNAVFENNGNLFVCSSGACPSGTPTGTGVIVASNHLGIGTSTPTDALDIVGTGPVLSIRDTSSSTPFTLSQTSSQALINEVADNPLLIGTNNTERLRITATGSVGIGTTSPAQQLSDAGLLYVGANGATGMGTATSTFQGDVNITGKLNVGTIDPVYTINGVQYATYGQSMVGEKEEAVADLTVDQYNPQTQTYEKAINFSDLPQGSDLWLFYQITDFGQNWNNLIVSLTAGFDGTVFFKKEPDQKTLLVESTAPGQVTARFIANRFDFENWPNLKPNQNIPDQTGFVLTAKN